MKPQIITIVIAGLLSCSSTSLSPQKDTSGAEITYDIYVAGTTGPGNFIQDTACYWKNSVRHDLSPSKSRVSALFIDGEDVYISGHYHKDRKIQSCYWKNGDLFDLEIDGTAYTSDVFVLGKDVYVSGHRKVTDQKIIPCYWKNGVATELEVLENGSGYTKSITADETALYVAGFLQSVKDEETGITACYWTNDKVTQLDSSPYKYSIASVMYVNKGELCIAGRLDDTKKECLCLWKGATRIDYLTVPNEYSEEGGSFFLTWEKADYNRFSDDGFIRHQITIHSMDLGDGGIYIVGEQNGRACYWMNGDMTELEKDGKEFSPRGLAVIDRNIVIVGKCEKSICVWEDGVRRIVVELKENERPSQYGFMKN